MYLHFMDKVAWISWGKQGNASKYFCATVEVRRNCSPPRFISECKKKMDGCIIATKVECTLKRREATEERLLPPETASLLSLIARLITYKGDDITVVKRLVEEN